MKITNLTDVTADTIRFCHERDNVELKRKNAALRRRIADVNRHISQILDKI